jgi:hypothetical protein
MNLIHAIRRPAGILPAHAHPLAPGAIPAWQLTLMAVTVVLLVAVLVAICYPGPERTVADQRTHRRSDDRIRRNPDPQDHPAGPATPTLARRNHRPGARP